jgi:hypothetical protein
MMMLQMLETVNSIPLAGKTVTLSFYAKAGANFSATSNILTAHVVTGTGTDQSCFTLSENLPNNPVTPANLTNGAIPINQNFNITTSWVRYSVTGTLASNITQAGVRFHYLPSGTAGAADFVEITGVQLEIEPIASPYEFKLINHELAQCQRYYYLLANGATHDFIAMGTYLTNTDVFAFVNFPVTMRGTPTMVSSSGANYYRFWTTGNNDDFNDTGLQVASRTGVAFSQGASGLVSGTLGRSGTVRTNNSLASIAFQVEL